MTDTGHIFILSIYEGGNGRVPFKSEVMNGTVKSIAYALVSSDISRISKKGVSMKLAKQPFVKG